MRVKPAGKIALLLLVIGIAFGVYRFVSGGKGFGGLLPEAQTEGSAVPIKADLPTIGDSAPAASIDGIGTPSADVATVGTPEVRMLIWAWNAQMGLLFANGGAKTTVGSLMEKEKVNLSLARQDDGGKMQESLVEFATELSKGNAQPTRGSHFVAIMGDGSATFLAAVNQQLGRLGSDYKAKIIASAGFSRGEDKFMGPAAWKLNPRDAMGGVVAGVLRDGDWNIAQKWLGDNGLKNNPDEKTYDPDALNWVATNDYIDAGEKYITGYSEDRDVVKNGKKTGEKKHITVQAAVTWTPGDVNMAEKKGGAASIVSTREYSAQMPHVIIGIDKWCKDNRQTVEGMISAICRGGDAVKASAKALETAADISAKVYGEKNGAYWAKYYKGVSEKDITGVTVDLGGSSVNNLADNMLLFGRVSGSANAFAATYKVFGDIVKAQYPSLVPSYPSVAEVLDTTYLDAVAKRASFDTSKTVVSAPVSAPKPGGHTNIISAKNWNIQFETGRASFTSQTTATLGALLNDLVIAGNTIVEIHGHTDNVGNADANMKLSEDRAFAVKHWLEAKARQNFPEGRIKVIAHGQTQPLDSNGSAYGRTKNRRVEIKLGSNN